MMKPLVISVLLTIPTLGIVWMWYDARMKQHLWNATTFDGARFRLAFPIEDWIRLQLVNLVLVILTLGIATPWAIVRVARFVAAHLALAGPVDLAAIRQEVQASPATGEGLAEVFDVDVGLG